MISAARGATTTESQPKVVGHAMQTLEDQIRRLIQDRRHCGHGYADRRRALCKAIKKVNRSKLQKQKEEQILQVLTDFRGLGEISKVGQHIRQRSIKAVVDEAGFEKTSGEDIAEVFASFYETLYSSHQDGAAQREGRWNPTGITPPFTMQELTAALKKLKSGKSSDSSGIVAEMLKFGGQSLRTIILELFNDITKSDALSPDSWKKSRLTVIFKKNDPKLVSNYRPIAIIPILYKLFSRMLCSRVQGEVFKHLSPDQAAYRPGFSVDDHLLTVTLLVERCKEFSQDLFV